MRPQIAVHAVPAMASTPARSVRSSAFQRVHANTRPSHRSSRDMAARSNSNAREAVDSDLVEELNLVSNRALEAMSAGQEGHAQALGAELQASLDYLDPGEDAESCRFLRVLHGLLNHRLPAEAAELDGMYAAAVNRILNQVSGSEWKLTEEGAAAQEEPSFSTWDDVFGGKQKAAPAQPSRSQPPDTLTFYRRLGVGSDAAPAEIKAAYRRQALQLHPDVNAAPDASARFAELSEAYAPAGPGGRYAAAPLPAGSDGPPPEPQAAASQPLVGCLISSVTGANVLSDSTSRSLYDRFGPDMASQAGAAAGAGNARQAWDEFKPHVRQNKHTRARAASGQPAGGSQGDGERQPQVGDVVEYPLRQAEMDEFGDGRTHGVGLLVGRNMDRGDAAKLPADRLSLCEVEPLRQEEAGSQRWMADELGVSSFAKLEEMRLVPVAAFDGRGDVWTITAPLSPGCGGPPLPEEVIF